MRGACISGWGFELPDRVVSNRELARELDLSADWIMTRTGISERRMAGPNETVASMAAAAGAAAMVRAGIEAADIDLVLVATCTPESTIPAVAPRVQAALGCKRAGAFDVNAACAGFVHALASATSHIAAGWAENVLVCGSEKLSAFIDQRDVGSSILFGDGAGAVIVSACEGATRVGPFTFGADGNQADLLHLDPDGPAIRMDGRGVYRHAVERMTEGVGQLLDLTKVAPGDVDYLVPHQANTRILNAVAERLGFPSTRVITNIEKVGNTSAASIPIALAQAADAGQIATDDLLLLIAFGAGFIWIGGLVAWGSRPLERTKASSELAYA